MIKILDLMVFYTIKKIATLQQFLSAKHTAYYLSSESLFFGILTAVSAYLIGLVTTAEVIFLFCSFLVFSVFSYVILKIRKDKAEPAVAQINLRTILFLLFVSSIPLISSYAVEKSILPTVIGFVSLVFYILALQYRNGRYRGENKFFVNKYSNSYNEWVEASVALDKTIKNIEDNKYKSYYWSLQAEESYLRAAKADTLELREIAMDFSSVAGMFSDSIRKNKRSDGTNTEDPYKSLKEAVRKSKDQICDNCGQQLYIGSISTTERYGGRDFCDHCKISNKDKSNSYSRKQESHTYGKKENQNSNNQKKTQDYSSSKSSSTKDKNDSSKSSNSVTNQKLKPYYEELGISEDTKDISKVKAAFREKVKETHPDAGGSPEDFRRIKEAKNKIIESLN